MLCIVPNIKETYENIRKLCDLISLNSIPFKLLSDFKVLLMINGQQTASATFPCPYCRISLSELKNRVDILNNNNSKLNKKECLKTYGNIKEDYKTFVSLDKDVKKSKLCGSTINPSILNEEDDVFVLEKCIIPELHIMQGIFNHIFWQGLVPLIGREKALIWPGKLHVISESYQGEAF